MKNTETMFNQIAQPHLTGEKQVVMMNILKEFNPELIDGMGILIKGETSGKRVRKVIVSHFDLVHPFERGFAEGRTIEITPEDIVYGALDNTITNAVLMNEILDNGLPADTDIFFSDGEESGMWGMSAFLGANREDIPNMFFINLDVTNDNWSGMTSVEYDYPNRDISIAIKENIVTGLQTERDADDMSPIVRAGGHGFSYCLPTREYCHTYRSNTTVKHVESYIKGLAYLVQELDVQEKEPDGTVYMMGEIV